MSGKRSSPGWTGPIERIPHRQIDVVGDQHECAAAEGPPHAARGIGENQGLDSQRGEYPHRQDRERRPDAPRTCGSGRSAPDLAFPPACPPPARPRGLRRSEPGKAGNVGVRDPHRIGEPLGEAARDPIRGRSRLPVSDARAALATAARVVHFHHTGIRHSRIPAMVADRKFASVPASMARKTQARQVVLALRARAPRCRRAECRPS